MAGIDVLLAGALAGLAVAMPLGAIGAYLVALGSRERLTTAAAAALGVASVDGVYAAVSWLGGSAVLTVLARASSVMSVVAAVVLIGLAARTLQLGVRRYRSRASAARVEGRALSARRAYLSLVGLTALNPATLVAFSAVVLGQPAHGSTARAAGPVASGLVPSELLAFTTGAFVASAAWQLLLVSGGSLLGRLLRSPRGELAVAACSATLMLVLAGAILLR